MKNRRLKPEEVKKWIGAKKRLKPVPLTDAALVKVLRDFDDLQQLKSHDQTPNRRTD